MIGPPARRHRSPPIAQQRRGEAQSAAARPQAKRRPSPRARAASAQPLHASTERPSRGAGWSGRAGTREWAGTHAEPRQSQQAPDGTSGPRRHGSTKKRTSNLLLADRWPYTPSRFSMFFHEPMGLNPYLSDQHQRTCLLRSLDCAPPEPFYAPADQHRS